jgi:hypothetical protein
MMSERLTVIVGAGASLPLGIPGTEAATQHLIRQEQQGRGKEIFADYPPIFDELLKVLKEGSNGRAAAPTFEHLLHAIESVHGFDHTVEAAVTNGLIDRVKVLARKPAHMWLAEKLLCDWLCEVFEGASMQAKLAEKWSTYKDFWATLADRFALDICTFNYDTCIEQAMPGIVQGFEAIPGEKAFRFDSKAFRNCGEHRLMHLHGAVTFAGRGPGVDANRFVLEDHFNDRYWHPEPSDARIARGGGPGSNVSQAGRRTIIGPIITGLQKTDKVLSAEPYMTYYGTLADWLESCPRLLVVGYGFGDLYVNSLLERLPRWHDNRRIACIDYGDDLGAGRRTPRWLQGVTGGSSILPNWFGQTTPSTPIVELLMGGFIRANPWRSPGGLCLLDFEGFLERSSQATVPVPRTAS